MTDDLTWLIERQRFGVHAGLERVKALLAALGNPQQHFDTVLVGGTNGKGSTSASLSAMLAASGCQVGLFTSPHLTHFAERFLVNGEMLPEAEMLGALATIRPQAEALEATFFEVVVALACSLFAARGVTLAVMEVGLGGRLDATNALEPVLSIITNVALDHTEVLGNTVAAIAAEKAGILRPGRPAVTAAAPEVWPILQATGAQLTGLPELRLRQLGWSGWQVTMMGAQAITFQTPLLGEHGARNAALAALAALKLGIPFEAVQRGAAQTRWPGRMEVLSSDRGEEVVLDGAHNPAGAQALVAALRSLGVERLPVVFGAAADKDIEGVAAALREIASEVILTRAVLSPRAAEPAELAHYFAPLPVRLSRNPAEALALLPAGRVLVCGSLYLIGEVRPLLLGQTTPQMERWQ